MTSLGLRLLYVFCIVKSIPIVGEMYKMNINQAYKWYLVLYVGKLVLQQYRPRHPSAFGFSMYFVLEIIYL